MAATAIEPLLPTTNAPLPKRVALVDRDPHASALLGRYLEGRGWTVRVITDARRAVREWTTSTSAELLVLRVEEDDPDAFELLGACAARTVSARVVVCGDLGVDARSLGVERLLPRHPRFSDVANALAALGHAFVTREVAS